MASIGGVTCTFVKGHVPRLKQRLELWQVPGLNGYGAAKMGGGDSQFQVVAVLFGSTAEITAWKTAIEAIQGTIVTITNDLPAIYPNCLIVHVSEMKSVPVRVLNLPTVAHRAEIVVEGVRGRMSVTYSTTIVGQTVTVTVSSTLSGTVYFYWYLDGQYLGMTTEPSRSFMLLEDEQARVDVVDSNDAGLDPLAIAPDAYPARKTLFWIRSLSDDVAYYRVDQKQDDGEWEAIGKAEAGTKWSFTLLTPRLVDLSEYTWRIVPLDNVGNEGTPLIIGPEQIVRTPDAPAFTVSLDEETDQLTFA